LGIPSANEQLRFLRDVQALLEDGQFVATYKYALLIALADLAVESGVTDDSPLEVPVRAIAGKFIEYYWQQAAPFIGGDAARVLRQNSGRQAAVISELLRLRAQGVDSLSQLRVDETVWRNSASKIARVIRVMPLFRLQVVGGTLRPFLYAHELQRDAIVLGRGVAYCLRQFHTLITGLARDRWVAMVRQLQENRYLVGHAEDIERFMFGVGREPIRQHLDVLVEVQHGACLYCERKLDRQDAHVDHFVPWSLHRCDALPNLVATHAACNLAKGDWLAAEPHLRRWAARNGRGDLHRLGDTANYPLFDGVSSITGWAYDRAYELGLPTWIRGRETTKLSPAYRDLLPSHARSHRLPDAGGMSTVTAG
jgi:5-methylcytosine-specific restriction endonuclease McrA